MSKYIDLEPILHISNIRKVCEYDETGEYITYLAIPLDVLENAVEHKGFWNPATLKRSFGTLDGIKCSRCGKEHVHSNLLSYPNYCSNCGAKMEFKTI